MIRDNIGYDFGAWKDAINKFIIDNDEEKYDELILTNDSYFGPFFGWKTVFEKMGTKNIDFWGMTKGTSYNFEEILVPVHIQSYFIVIKKRMLYSSDFKNYWKKIPYANTFMDCVARNEGLFANYFEKLGYRWEVFCDTNPKKTGLLSATYLFNSDDMLPYYHLPLVKKKTFVRNLKEMEEFGLGEDVVKILKYIRNHTEYNIEMIYDNLLRVYPLEQIDDCLPPIYIINENEIQDNISKTIILDINQINDFKIYADYLNDLPSDVKLVLIYKNNTVLNIASDCLNRDYDTLSVKSTSLPAIINECFDYVSKSDYLCFMKCTDSIPGNIVNIYDYAINKTIRNNGWDNLLYNSNYINNITKIMKENKIGLMIPPTPHNDYYLQSRVNNWKKQHKDVETIINKMELQLDDNYSIPPLLSYMYWCDTTLIKKIANDNNWIKDSNYNWQDELVSTPFDYLLPYIAKKYGMMTAVAINNSYVASFMRSHILAFEESKKINPNDVQTDEIVKFISRHGKIFSVIKKIEKKFR